MQHAASEGYETRVPTHRTAYAKGDFTGMLEGAVPLLYWTALKASRDESRAGHEELWRAAGSLQSLFASRSSNIDDHLSIAARDLARVGRALYDDDHELTRIGEQLRQDLFAAQRPIGDVTLQRALHGMDSRGRPYGVAGAARVEPSNEARHLLYSVRECVQAMSSNVRYEPKKEDIAVVVERIEAARRFA